ncbi:hypothetical protein BKA63DRAFT_154884 [Paraphoma chrysanthemicola]|nr:hypothetical protein BKA63DRAFT_154884 [Paraphoma chrysanthemicola]
MALDTLPAILYNEGFITRWCVAVYVVAAIAFVNLLQYTLLIALMVTVIEEPSLSPSHPANTRNTMFEHISLLDRHRDIGDPEDLDDWPRSRSRPIFTGTYIAVRIWRQLAPLRSLVWPPSIESRIVVTRHILSTLQHLRYHSSSGLYFARGLVVYILLYRLIPAAFESLFGFVIILFHAVIDGIVGDLSKSSLFIADVILWILIRGVYFTLASEAIGFHTLRVVSTSTQVTTNMVSEIFDPKTARPRRIDSGLPPLSLAICGAFYSITLLISEIVPYLMVYGPVSASKESALYQSILRATVWKFLLTILLNLPAFLVMAKLQAQTINSKEPTIVRYSVGKRISSRSLILAQTDWLRVFRNLVQGLTLGSLLIVVVLLFGTWLTSRLEHQDMLRPWIFSYLDPSSKFGFLGLMHGTIFWANNFLMLINPWKSILYYTDEFDRWMIFGVEGT